MCCGFAGFLLSAVWTLCQLFWKSSVVPAATTITEPKETCDIITRSLQQLRENALGLVESKPPTAPPQYSDDESTIGSNQETSESSSSGSSRSSTLNSYHQGVQNHTATHAVDGRQQRPGKNERTVSFSPLPITSFSETHSWPTSPGKRSKALSPSKRVVSSPKQQLTDLSHPQPSPPLTPPTPVFTAPSEPPLPSSSSSSTAFPAPGIDYSKDVDPSVATARSRSPTRKLRKFMSLHWPTQHQTAASTPGEASSPNKSEMKCLTQTSKQLKTLRKSRSDTRDCLRASSRETVIPGESPKASPKAFLSNLPLPSPKIIVSSDSTSALLSPPLPTAPQRPQLKKRQNTARTDPYAAPYFCAVPGSVDATQTLARVTPSRRATSPAPMPVPDSTSGKAQAEFGAELRRRGASATFPMSGR